MLNQPIVNTADAVAAPAVTAGVAVAPQVEAAAGAQAEVVVANGADHEEDGDAAAAAAQLN